MCSIIACNTIYDTCYDVGKWGNEYFCSRDARKTNLPWWTSSSSFYSFSSFLLITFLSQTPALFLCTSLSLSLSLSSPTFCITHKLKSNLPLVCKQKSFAFNQYKYGIFLLIYCDVMWYQNTYEIGGNQNVYTQAVDFLV